jgi:carboxypeptidase C (cathepsin A)
VTINQAIRAFAATLLLIPAFARSASSPSEAAEDRHEPAHTAITHHVASINGQRIAYAASVSDLQIPNDAGIVDAQFTSIAYTREPAVDPIARPVTFVFNGGPGSSSTLVHLGAFGPRRVLLPDGPIAAGVGPVTLTDNAHSLLDVTDLVFIDPVGTGFSQALGAAKDSSFWGVTADARSVGSFIRAWTTAHGRWNSPKYVAGESYGALRAIKTARYLESSRTPLFFNGFVLISGPLDFVSFVTALGDDKGFPLLVPTMAAAAWFHGRIDKTGRTFEAFIDEARQFAKGPYTAALYEGSTLSADQRTAIAVRLQGFTGVPAAVFLANNLRVRASVFSAELLRADGRRVGRLDDRFSGPASMQGDPSSAAIRNRFEPGMTVYLRSELGVAASDDYRQRIDGDWKWDIDASSIDDVPGVYLNAGPILTGYLQRNANSRVFVAAGYYDLVVPFMSLEYTAAHLLDEPGRVTLEHYRAGHMLYIDEASHAKLAGDLRRFISGTPP